MILDAENQFSVAQALTVTAVSTNAIDAGPQKLGTTNGARDIEVLLHVNTTFTAAGAATLQVQMISSANANLSSPTVHDQSDVLALADLVAGTRVRFEPRIPHSTKRYWGLNYVVATGPMTAGAITASIVTGRQTNR